MLDAFAFSSSLLGFALLHAAVPDRVPFTVRAQRHFLWGVSLRFIALLLAVASPWLWVTAHGGATGGILFVLSWALSGSAFVVAAPVTPRLVWGIALLLAVSLTAGTIVRGLHGP